MSEIQKGELEAVILSHICDPQFSVERLADAFGIGTSYLREIIERDHGFAPQWLIETTRLKVALKLMVDSGEYIYCISGKVGYHNVRTFRKAFIKRLNMTPSECRSLLLGRSYSQQLFGDLVARLTSRDKSR